MKLKIISEGTPRTTKIINVETGEPLENVRSISWEISKDTIAKAKIEFYWVSVELTGEFKDV